MEEVRTLGPLTGNPDERSIWATLGTASTQLKTTLKKKFSGLEIYEEFIYIYPDVFSAYARVAEEKAKKLGRIYVCMARQRSFQKRLTVQRVASNRRYGYTILHAMYLRYKISTTIDCTNPQDRDKFITMRGLPREK